MQSHQMFKTWPQNCLSLKVQTSDEELLPIDPGVALGLLQQADPVVHLLGSVRVAVDHAVRRDDHKRVWSVETHMFFSKKKKVHVIAQHRFSRSAGHFSPVGVV